MLHLFLFFTLHMLHIVVHLCIEYLDAELNYFKTWFWKIWYQLLTLRAMVDIAMKGHSGRGHSKTLLGPPEFLYLFLYLVWCVLSFPLYFIIYVLFLKRASVYPSTPSWFLSCQCSSSWWTSWPPPPWSSWPRPRTCSPNPKQQLFRNAKYDT